MTITDRGRSDILFDSCLCFIVDLRMQHKFHCMNLIIGRNGRTYKNEPNNTHIPNIFKLLNVPVLGASCIHQNLPWLRVALGGGAHGNSRSGWCSHQA